MTSKNIFVKNLFDLYEKITGSVIVSVIQKPT